MEQLQTTEITVKVKVRNPMQKISIQKAFESLSESFDPETLISLSKEIPTIMQLKDKSPMEAFGKVMQLLKN